MAAFTLIIFFALRLASRTSLIPIFRKAMAEWTTEQATELFVVLQLFPNACHEVVNHNKRNYHSEPIRIRNKHMHPVPTAGKHV